MKPIGTIVYLTNGDRKVMIMNRGPIRKTMTGDQLFDYSGCLYPVGLNPEQILYFNEENIDKVVFEGYFDDEETRYQELYEQWIKKMARSIRRGM